MPSLPILLLVSQIAKSWKDVTVADDVSKDGYTKVLTMLLVRPVVDFYWRKYPWRSIIQHQPHLSTQTRLWRFMGGPIWQWHSKMLGSLTTVTPYPAIPRSSAFYQDSRSPLPAGATPVAVGSIHGTWAFVTCAPITARSQTAIDNAVLVRHASDPALGKVGEELFTGYTPTPREEPQLNRSSTRIGRAIGYFLLRQKAHVNILVPEEWFLG